MTYLGCFTSSIYPYQHWCTILDLETIHETCSTWYHENLPCSSEKWKLPKLTPKNALYWPCQRHVIPNLLVYITSIYNKKKVCKRSKSWVCYMGVVRWYFQIQVKYKILTHILVVKIKIFCDLPLVTWPCILCREWKTNESLNETWYNLILNWIKHGNCC